ncbi:mucin-4-like [Sipha flava]|uniref:Mucin-4-like n=1 Tax=Sipha flava TaxID=143950 RepID=A0A8B8FZ48_9HEMI|nr:mucin-4-like [Sipha flava]
MKGWRLVVLLCTALLCEPVRPQEKWSRPDQPSKRIDDWVPITASCPSCKKNLEPNEATGGGDEIGSLLNPPAAPSARAFNFNSKQNSFNRAPSGEPYEITTPPATSGQFFSQQQAPKIPQPVHFPVPFFGQPNPFQTRFQGVPNFTPQFTFIPQQPQPQPKENKVTFPESPFIQQQNKGSVQLVYVPIEALQRQKPRLQVDRPLQQQSQLDIKSQSPFETGKLKFQRPPQPFDPPRFPSAQQFEQDPNRFAPPPPPSSFEQDTSRFPPPSQLFGPEKPAFPNQLKEQRPEFLPQNEQPASPQSYQFVEDSRNPSSNFFQFHDNRFQKPSFGEEKPKDFKPQVQQSFAPNIDESRQESSQSFVSNFDENSPRQGPPPQNVQQNFQEIRPRQEPRPQNGPSSSFQETRPRPEQRPKNVQSNFQETRPRQEPPSPPQFVPKFEEPKLEPQQQFIPNFQETRPRQELPSPPQFVPKFEEQKLEPQQQFVSNFRETRPRQEPPPSQFISKFEEPKLEPQQQFIPTFQELPQQEVPQQTFTPNFESLRPKPESPQNFVPNFQETKPKQESQESFVEVKPKSKPKVQSLSSSTQLPQQTFNLPSSTEQIQTSTPYPPPHQPPLSVYMEKRLDNRINEVLTILKDAKTIPVLDTIGTRSPKVFVGPSDLDAPRGYVKFELPYLSSLDITKIDSMADRLPFFVAPLNFKPPFGYSKIPFPPPHIGSVVVSSKPQSVGSTTEFVPFALTSQLPTEVNSLQQSVSSTTQRGTERAPITSTTSSATKRGRQRKPLHRGTLSSFSTSTPVNDVTERQRDQFTTPAELQRLPEISPSVSEQPQFIESTPTPTRQKFSRKPVEQTTVFESTQAPIQKQQQQQQFDNSQPQQQQFDNSQQQQQQQFDNSQQQQQQQFDNSQQQQFLSDQQVPQQQQNFLDTLPQQQFFNNQQPSQQTFFENQPQPSQQPFFENQQPSQQPIFENQQPSQQPFFENQQQFLDNPPQTIQEQALNNVQPSAGINNEGANQQQFISSSTEKQIFKNFQQIQPLSQYQVGNNFLNQQSSSTEQVQAASDPPQTVSNEPQTAVTEASTETPKLRQRLSYYDKLLLSSTQVPVEITSANVESSERPRERPKLRPRQRLTTTRKPTTELSTSEEVSGHVTDVSTQRYNPLRRRRPSTTTTTTEQTETTATRSSLRSRTTQSGRSEYVRSRSRRPLATTTTSTTTTTEAPAAVQQHEDVNDVHSATGQDEQRKIEEAASFWNEPVTIQQSHSYELDTRYTQAPSSTGKYSSGEPPADEDPSKDKFGNEKKAHDPNSEKKGPGRRGHWVRVRVKKPQDNLDTAESQNSLGPLSANAIRELATKPTAEFNGPYSSSEPSAEVTTLTAATSAETDAPTAAPTVTTTTTSTTTTTTTTASPLTTVAVPSQDYAVEGVTEERLAETTVAPPPPPPPSASAASKYPDDEQDEAFQRNLADMLAKFISGNGDQQQQQHQQQQQQPQQDATTAAADETTAETVFAGADVELTTATSAAVTELPSTAPVTSTTTKVSMETEICYKGRCVKSKKNKQITDLMSEP